MAKAKKSSNAIDLLMEDHRKVETLFKEFESLKDEDEQAAAVIIESACMALTIHDKLETEVFYPAVREQAEDEDVEDLLDEAEVEHETVRELIEKLEEMEVGDEKQKAHFTVLMEYVKHHVTEEEEELFPELEDLEDLDLDAIGAEMQERKEALMAELD
ncbi:MAG: hemerythrin domain-containing protein [Burkholderiales bacterium]